jgi:translation initiation factor 2B subunit (eIF-2B alpha/beta/delta family)
MYAKVKLLSPERRTLQSKNKVNRKGEIIMASAPTMTIIKMLETLPRQLQDRVVEHVREYIEDLRDEFRWNESFSRTQKTLVNTARLARKKITEGKASPLDFEKLCG